MGVTLMNKQIFLVGIAIIMGSLISNIKAIDEKNWQCLSDEEKIEYAIEY